MNNNINECKKIVNSLHYMNNQCSKAIKEIFQNNYYEIFFQDILYINNLYNNHKLKDFTHFYTNPHNLQLRKKYNNSRQEVVQFIDYYEGLVAKHINSSFSSLLYGNNNEIITSDNLIDFIHFSNKKIAIHEQDFHQFIKIIIFCENNKDYTKILLSYIKDIQLTNFFKILDDFLKNINKNDIFIENLPLCDQKIISQKKRGFYRTYIEKFVYLLTKEQITIMQNSPFYNNVEQYISITYEHETLKDKETKSHFIQSAYLKRIFNNKNIDFNGYIINPFKYAKSNPYCKALFYGSSISSDSIEKELANIENSYIDYLTTLESYIDKKSFYTEESFYKLNCPIEIECKLIFLLNYIRTPSFSEDLFFSYIQFIQNNESDILNQSALDFSKNFSDLLNNLDLRFFFKEIQLSFIKYFLDIFKTKSVNFNIDMLFKIFSDNITPYYTKFYTIKINQKFINIVFFKLINFLNDSFSIGVSTFEINEFTDNLFILKTNANNEYDLFENDYKFEVGYFPINENKIIYFLNHINHQIDHNYIEHLSEQYIPKSNIPNMMINKRCVFKIKLIS